MIEFFIPGLPVPKGRPKLSTRGGFARAYTPAKTRDYESHVQTEALKYLSEPLEGPLCVSLTFYLPIPSSTPKKTPLDGLPHIKRPDLDNLLKSVTDGLNGIAYLDDSHIWKLEATKVYGHNPGVLVIVSNYALP